ncbi:uncharacterized protein TNCV_4396211 [Trichonephila clavipes]|uniref:DUF7041 domain-containing protein n=1 Tax=Trichonephila clavipes TaxID=2585209 RepID=A0A8X6W5B2_TRICX|nr:uncharacterized protein TNCV_4396211 [Trichonephila clavipes]
MREADDLISKIQELQGIIEQQNQRLQQSSSITNESSCMEPAQVYRISPKLPPFWADKPTVWFAQAESQFALAHITSDVTKFHYIVANFDSRYAAEVDDIIKPPTTGMYEKLKNQLINRLSLSEEQRVRKVLGREEVGDRKPSQFLRHLRSLAGGIEIKTTLLRSLLLQRLPLHVQAILQGQSTLEPDQMAGMADRIMEVPLLTSVPSVNSIDPIVASASPRVSVTIESLPERVEDLAKQVELLQTRSNSRA